MDVQSGDAGCLAAAGVAAAGAIAAATLLPAQPTVTHDPPSPDIEAAEECSTTPRADDIDYVVRPKLVTADESPTR
jgi:hypothetical protein